MEYAMYKGEELLEIGTLQELAKFRGVDEETIYYYTTPAYARKFKRKDGKPSQRVVVIKLDDEEGDDESNHN